MASELITIIIVTIIIIIIIIIIITIIIIIIAVTNVFSDIYCILHSLRIWAIP